MNRKIKFRGLSFDKGWIYGNLIKSAQSTWIRESDYYNFKVKTETVGQYTGLHDKNGKEIYEGDIIHINDEFLNEFNYLIEWNEEYLRYYLYSVDKEKLNKLGGILEAHLNSLEVEVIGNIYDNPELLGGEDER